MSLIAPLLAFLRCLQAESLELRALVASPTDVAERVIKKAGPLLKDVNPNFKAPKKPFKRMDYADAIKYCNEHKIMKDDGTDFQYGDVRSLQSLCSVVELCFH